MSASFPEDITEEFLTTAKGDRVNIRPALVSDAETMVRGMNPASLQNFDFFLTPVNVARQAEYLERMAASQYDELFAIMWNGMMVGTCGLHEVNFHGNNARIGCMLFTQNVRGMGIGSAALRLLQHYAFHYRGARLHKLYANVILKNAEAVSKYERLGFRAEGVLREHYCLGEEYLDMIMMARYRAHWSF